MERNEELILLNRRDKFRRSSLPIKYLIAFVVTVICLTVAVSLFLVFGEKSNISNIYNINISQSIGGQIISENEDITTTQIVNEGEDKKFIIAPDEGYYVSSLVIDGVSYNINNFGGSFNYVFQDVKSGHTILATFEEKTFSRITVTQSANGTITPDSVSLDYGSNQTFTVTPNVGYESQT
jgi:hypothetical protein